MPSPLAHIAVTRRHVVACCAAAALLVLIACGTLLVAGCEGRGPGLAVREAVEIYPPRPQIPRVVALGTLRGAPGPSAAEIRLAMFLFGVEPPPPLTIVSPTGLAASADSLLICDNVLHTVFRWDSAAGRVTEERFRPPPEHPVAIDIAPNGDRLICDHGVVVRADATGEVLLTYALGSQEFRPAGVLVVDDQVWVTNLAAHRIEVFDAASGEHLRSIGERGSGPGQFALPRGLARRPDGRVCVVDMLNNRVQVFDARGNWLDNVGRPGSGVGSFGCPKDVAVGPDGTIFVTDAFSQRVHAFTPDGQPLLAFGQPGSGIGELTLPSGIAISGTAPQTGYELPAGSLPAYYVLVAEQLKWPGVRVYAWLKGPSAHLARVAYAADATERPPVLPEAAEANPHWHAQRCTSCHESAGGRLLPIAPAAVDPLCRSCHDDHQAAIWAHPVDRLAEGPGLRVPAGWPLSNGRLACLTCHDILRHCSTDARRPLENAGALRDYDQQDQQSFCAKCHVETAAWFASPHGQLDEQGRINAQACLFCHRQVPPRPHDGRRRFDAKLRSPGGSCLNCHVRHWDYYPAGHVGRPVTPEIRRNLLAAQSRGRAQPATEPARFPLANGHIACYTCHNPHQLGLFPAGSELAARAASRTDAVYQLRADRPELCLQCHDK